MKLPWASAAVAALIGFLTGSGCLSKSARPVGSPTSVRSAASTEPVLAAAPDESSPSMIVGVADAKSVLDAPDLAEVKTLVATSDYEAAAKALEAALPSAPPEEKERLWYQLGKLRALAEDLDEAAGAFDEVAKSGGPLTPYAQLGAAQALLRAGHADASLERAALVDPDSQAYPATKLLQAEALELKHEHDAAIEIWQAYLAESRHPAGWISVALRMADAMLASHPDTARAEKAALLARRIVVEAPTSGAVSRALDFERRALALVPESRAIKAVVPHGKRDSYLPSDWARALTPADQLTRAAALADTQNFQDAVKALDAMTAALGAKAARGEVGCRMQVLLASVLSKLKDRVRAADAYGVAIGRCASFPDAMVESLYFGGKASASANRCEEAMLRFARVESDFHEHRFADDARLRGAECALELGDEKHYVDMISSMPADYPEGDMVTEALFRVAVRRMVKKDWAGALGLLQQARDFKVKETPSNFSGKIAYFFARALYGSGDLDGGRRALMDVVRDYPLSYYMSQAYARLCEIDPATAKSVLDAVLLKEPAGPFQIEDEEVFHSIGFARAVELLREGETDYARRELSKLGLLKDSASPNQLWAVAALYASAGMPQVSHTFPRLKVFDWFSHYPQGRWRKAWEIAYPRVYAELIEREAKRSGIPAALAYAVMREESAFDPEAVSPSRAFGLMQLIVPTAKKVAKDLGLACDEQLLGRPETNVALGCRLLADLRARFPENPYLAVPSYNAGPGAPARWLAARESDDFDLWVEQIPYEETRKYTKKVLASYAAYAFLYEKNGLDAALRLPLAVAARRSEVAQAPGGAVE